VNCLQSPSSRRSSSSSWKTPRSSSRFDRPSSRIVCQFSSSFYETQHTQLPLQFKYLTSCLKYSISVIKTFNLTQTCSFSVVGPTTWNGLPIDLRHLPNGACSQFYHLLKTVLFRLAWVWVGILKGHYINFYWLIDWLIKEAPLRIQLPPLASLFKY